MIARNYITILGWMAETLGLKGYELIAYAFIYGFTQDGAPKKISYSYLAKWLGTTRETSMATISRLQQKGLVTKTQRIEKKVRANYYMADQGKARAAIQAAAEGGKKNTPPPSKQKTPPPSEGNLPPTGQENTPPKSNNGLGDIDTGIVRPDPMDERDGQDKGASAGLRQERGLRPETMTLITRGIINPEDQIQVGETEWALSKLDEDKAEHPKEFHKAFAYVVRQIEKRRTEIENVPAYLTISMAHNIKALVNDKETDMRLEAVIQEYMNKQ